MLSKLDIEQELKEKDGEITDELDVIWQQKDMAVKDKLDAYGYVFTELDSQEEKLKTLKTKIQKVLSRIDNDRNRLKVRLNFLSNGESLKGNIFSFHPFTTTHRVVLDQDKSKLKDSEIYLTIEIRKDYWNTLLEAYDQEQYELEKSSMEKFPIIDYDIKTSKTLVSELPDNHPALTIVGNPSVRIT